MGIQLSSERYEEIKRIIIALFEKYSINCIPIDSFKIAYVMGITVIPYSAFSRDKIALLFKKSSAGFCAERNVGEWFIYYNDAMNAGRVANTVMHEIGHIVLDHSEDSELAEKEVKFFAKYALAPPVIIHELKLNTPNEISKTFGISNEAANIARSYYMTWLRKFYKNNYTYTDYENRLRTLFSDAILHIRGGDA